MKKLFTTIFVLAFVTANSQVNFTPFAGINSTGVYDGYGYQKGGSFGLAGLEIEWKQKLKRQKPLFISLVSGVSYLSNGYHEYSNFTFGSFFYNSSVSHLKTSYWQIPFIARLNWQPFPLIEDWVPFVGVGITNNFLIKAHLSEKSTALDFSSSSLSPPPTTEHYEDSGDITDVGSKYFLFRRIEIGMKFKKFLVAYRISVSLQDMYKDIENVWDVPAIDSEYIGSHNFAGTRKEKHTEIIIGYRIAGN